MSLPRMYTEFAEYCQLINPREDYADEAPQWAAVLRKHLGAGRHEILELGVGGGNNLSYLVDEFQATAVDLSPEMLAQAAKLMPQVELLVGDMRTVRLGRTFRAVLIHDAIDYMTSEQDLRATFATAAEHLDIGGVLVTSPDFYSETFRGPIASCATNAAGAVSFTNMEYMYDPDSCDTTMDVLSWYLLNESGRLRVEHDRHVYGLFSMETWLRLMGEAGFAVERVPFEVGDPVRETYLLVGVLKNRPGGPS